MINCSRETFLRTYRYICSLLIVPAVLGLATPLSPSLDLSGFMLCWDLPSGLALPDFFFIWPDDPIPAEFNDY